MALAIISHPKTRHMFVFRVLWAFCVYLEAVSVVPQLVMMQRANVVEKFTAHYVFALGLSRFVSCAHWVLQVLDGDTFVFKAMYMGLWPACVLLSEIVQTFVLADFWYDGCLCMRIYTMSPTAITMSKATQRALVSSTCRPALCERVCVTSIDAHNNQQAVAMLPRTPPVGPLPAARTHNNVASLVLRACNLEEYALSGSHQTYVSLLHDFVSIADRLCPPGAWRFACSNALLGYCTGVMPHTGDTDTLAMLVFFQTLRREASNVRCRVLTIC